MDASGAGLGPFSPAAYTLMSKSSLCVAMGTMATLTKRRAKRSERERKTQGGEEKKGRQCGDEREVGLHPGDEDGKERVGVRRINTFASS